MRKMPYHRVDSREVDGEINYEVFEESCRRIYGEGGSVVAVVNAGSTVVGAHDRLGRFIDRLDAAAVPPEVSVWDTQHEVLTPNDLDSYLARTNTRFWPLPRHFLGVRDT